MDTLKLGVEEGGTCGKGAGHVNLVSNSVSNFRFYGSLSSRPVWHCRCISESMCGCGLCILQAVRFRGNLAVEM